MNLDDLPPKTQAFLTNLRDEEIDTLEDGIRLVNAVRMVGTFMKWVIIGLLGVLSGIVMFGETLIKISSWFRLH